MQVVKQFLKENHVPGRPLLIGLSGGSDSTSLLYLLLECRQQGMDLDIHLAHIDHGWRAESGKEAALLSALAKRLGLPFYLHSLQPEKGKKNLEERGRIARLSFFEEVYRRGNFQALLLGHQAEDQTETILKRLFEGASLFALEGMKSVSQQNGMYIWRPLLSIPRIQLRKWLQKKEISWWEDPTNEDPAFLRTRLRQEIIPFLSEKFGKEISSRLAFLGESAQEVKEYLQERIDPYLRAMEKGPFGSLLDLTPFSPLPDLEVKALLKYLFGQNISQPILSAAAKAVQERRSNVHFYFKSCTLFLHRGMLFLIGKMPPPFTWRGRLEESCFVQEKWQWSISRSTRSNGEATWGMSNWRTFFLEGRVEVCLPEGQYTLAPAAGLSMGKWWSKQRTPAFLRSSLPLVVKEDGQVVHEFLTGRLQKEINECSKFISLEIKCLDN